MRHGILAQETIAFQKNLNFFNNLTELFEKLRQVSVKDLADHVIVQKLQKCILDESGISCNILIREDKYGIRISIPQMNPNHVLFDDLRQSFASTSNLVQLMDSDTTVVKGFVNPATGKIGGAFSKVVNDLHIPIPDLFNNRLTAKHLAAIILHELGHIWAHFYMFVATVRTSAIFDYLEKTLVFDDKEADQTKLHAKRVIAITTAGKAAHMSKSELESLYQLKSKQAIQFIIVSNIAEECKSDIGQNIYDPTTWEYLADEYAVRMGAGTELAVALDILARSSPLSRSHRSFARYLAFEVIKFTLLAVPGLTFLGIMLMAMDGSSNYHDDPEARFRRIRNQFIEQLKDKSLSKDELKSIDEDIKLLDGLLNDVKDRRQFISVIIEAVVPSLRRRRTVLDKVRILEQLAANELFNMAQQLRKESQPV